MKILKDGTIISYSGNSVAIVGKSPSGRSGYWVFPVEKRIFQMDNVIRIHKYSLKKIINIAKGI